MNESHRLVKRLARRVPCCPELIHERHSKTYGYLPPGRPIAGPIPCHSTSEKARICVCTIRGV